MIAEIANFPTTLLVLLAVLTVLGAVMGYCIAVIRGKRSLRKVIDQTQRQLKQEQVAAQSDLRAARRKIDLLQQVEPRSPIDGLPETERENELQKYSKQQANRIQTLEGQLESLEQQQARLQQDFAIHKGREIALAQVASGYLSETDNLPTLIRRVGPSAALPAGSGTSIPRLERPALEHPSNEHDDLSDVLMPELDIPSLAESELPDLDDELEFDLTVAEDSGADSRG